MSETIFNDIGYDLVEKISPPSIPINNIIENHPPISVSNQSASATSSKKLLNNTLIVAGVLLLVYGGYKFWEWKKEKDDKKRGY